MTNDFDLREYLNEGWMFKETGKPEEGGREVSIYDWTGEPGEYFGVDNDDPRWKLRETKKMSEDEIDELTDRFKDDETDSDFNDVTLTSSVWYETDDKAWRLDVEEDDPTVDDDYDDDYDW